LQRHLPSAPAAYLSGALENPELADESMLLLLRNRRATPAILQRIGNLPRWRSNPEIRKRLVLHPRTPTNLTQRLVGDLYWVDLAAVSEDSRLHRVVRQRAEQQLAARLDKLALGERIALARRAGRGLSARLIGPEEARVLQSLLGNPKFVEMDAVKLASLESAPAEVLGGLFEHPRWGRAYAVRLALAGNPRTPIAAALRVIPELKRQDLQRLIRDDKVPRIVRMGADRHLEQATRAPGRSSDER